MGVIEKAINNAIRAENHLITRHNDIPESFAEIRVVKFKFIYLFVFHLPATTASTRRSIESSRCEERRIKN